MTKLDRLILGVAITLASLMLQDIRAGIKEVKQIAQRVVAIETWAQAKGFKPLPQGG